jgi:hypothetical protein
MGAVRAPSCFVALGVSVFMAGTAPAAPAPDKLVAGAAAARGPSLVAGDEGAEYDLRGGAHVVLAAGSEFAFEPSLKLKLRKPGDPETLTRSLRLVHGRADVTIPAATREPTAVLFRGAGKLSAVAKEGTATFLAEADRTTVAARSGEMLVGLGNEWKPLREGLARTLAAEDPTAIPHPILPAPSIAVANPLTIVKGDAPARASATWATVKDATGYDVTLAKVVGDRRVTVSHQTLGAPSASFPALAPGAYALTVVGVDRQGLLGAASEPAQIRVVGLDAKAGVAVADDGAIVLGRDQRVGLVGAEGLEVSYGNSQDFAAAPATLGLAHGASTRARLRVPGSKDEAILQLEPRGLRANVQIGPRAAHWPLDRVIVQIELYDASGRTIPEDVALTSVVTVNMEPVAVKWERSGHTLRATLPPSMAAGPWVVRAEVQDQRGELLGRDFLEIATGDGHAADAVAHR